MTTFVTSTFTAPDNTLITAYTGELGATWTRSLSATNVGAPKILSNQLITTETGVNENYYASGTPGSADYTVTLDYTNNGATTNEICGPTARVSTSVNNAYSFIYFRSGGGIRLYKTVAGTQTQIGSTVTFTAASGQTYRMTIDASGTTIAGRLQRLSDNLWLTSAGAFQSTQVNCLSVTDALITAAGQAGFWFSSDPGSGSRGTLDNYSAATGSTPATGVTMTGPSTGAVGSPSTNFSVGVTPIGGTITGTVTVTPSDGGAGGTFTPTTVALTTGSPTGTFTYTASSTGAKTISATNDGSLTNPTNLTYTASSGAATTITLTGPTTGTVGVASTNFTVGANGSITGTVVVTPNDSSGGGTFTPTSVSINTGSPTGTFTYTAASTGAKTIAVTNNGALTNPSTITYTASSSATKAPNDPGIIYSPYNWLVGSGSAKSINGGAYFRTLFTGSSCTLNFDLTNDLTPFSRLVIRVDRRTWQPTVIASTVSVSMPTGQSNTTHLLEVVFDASTETVNRWNAPQNTAVVMTGITLASGSESLIAPQVRPNQMLMYGDSITEGVRTLALNGTNDVDRNSAYVCWPLELGTYLNAEVGVVGFGATGISTAGSGNVPKLPSSYASLWASQARNFSPAPKYCIWLEGQNDGATNTQADGLTALNGMLSAMAGTQFILFRPFSGNQAANLQVIQSTCNEPGRVRYIDTTGFFNTADSSDALHPYGYEDISVITPKMSVAILTPATTTTRAISLTLTTDGSTPAINLTGLKWSFWDTPLVGSLQAPSTSGTGATTNGSGVFSVSVTTTLSSGGIGWLTVTNSDGTLTQSPAESAFSGPVQVA